MRRQVLPAVAVLVTAVFVGACGSTPPVTPTSLPIDSPSANPTSSALPTASAEPTPTASVDSTAQPTSSPLASPTPFAADREYVSDDGQLTMLVPDGAIPADVTLSALARGQGDLPLELLGLEVRNAFYEVGPSSVEFASPVRMERAARLKDLDIDLAAEGLPLLVMAERSAAAEWSWLDAAALSVADRDLVVSGDAASPGLLFAFGGRDFTTLEWSAADRVVPVGDTVRLLVYLAAPEEEGNPPLLGPLAPILSAEASGIIEPVSTSDSDGTAAVQEFRCVAAGEAPVGVTFAVSNLYVDSVLFGQLGLGPASTNVTVTQTVTCSDEFVATPEPDESAGATPPSI